MRRLFWMVPLLALFVLFSGCHQPSVENGAVLFRKDCARCHIQKAGQADPAPALTGYFERKPQPTTQQAKEMIRNGKRAMPPFGERLSSDEIDDVIAYLKTLS
jgi:cytochrome c6